jgi:hypothetical protein
MVLYIKNLLYKILKIRSKYKAEILISIYSKKRTDLDILCDKFGTDKGGSSNELCHNYATYYDLVFQKYRNCEINFFECGIGTNNADSFTKAHGISGSSLRLWKEFFPKGRIYGADIDESTLFKEDRITTLQMDQTKANSVKYCFKKFNVLFDICIDDGLHEFAAGISLFETSKKYLKEKFIYVIEDVGMRDCISYLNYFSEMDFQISVIEFDSAPGYRSNHRLVVIEPKDL